MDPSCCPPKRRERPALYNSSIIRVFRLNVGQCQSVKDAGCVISTFSAVANMVWISDKDTGLQNRQFDASGIKYVLENPFCLQKIPFSICAPKIP
jgi:hypothetical protein